MRTCSVVTVALAAALPVAGLIVAGLIVAALPVAGLTVAGRPGAQFARAPAAHAPVAHSPAAGVLVARTPPVAALAVHTPAVPALAVHTPAVPALAVHTPAVPTLAVHTPAVPALAVHTLAVQIRAVPATRRHRRRPRQLITVRAASHHTSYAVFRAYRRAHGRWVRVFGPWRARIGYNGMARPGRKREGDGRTPSGRYGFGFFFGVRPNPGVAFRYRRARSYDVWDDDPASPRYNEWVSIRRHNPGASPEPMHQIPAYDYGAVIAYNTARTPGLGSAIFLHVGTGTATAGCVSLPARRLLRVLRWLRPWRSPRIILSAG